MLANTEHAQTLVSQDLMTILPMVDPLWKLEVTGQQILEALENGVSQYPKLEGRFPQVSGIRFTFDPSQPSGRRICETSVLIAQETLQKTKKYTLCTKGYIASGRDGYSVFKHAKTILDHEAGIILNSEVRNFFQTCRQRQANNTLSLSSTNISNISSPLKINTSPSRLAACVCVCVCVCARDTHRAANYIHNLKCLSKHIPSC